jgi:hypothetical protein
MADRWHVIENELLPLRSIDKLGDYRLRLLEMGYSRPQVAGCLEFLLGKARGEDVKMSSASRSTYRKMLTALIGAPGAPPDETGRVGIVALAAIAGVLGTVAVLAGHAGGLVAAAPIIQDSVNVEDEVAEPGNCCWEPPVLLAA